MSFNILKKINDNFHKKIYETIKRKKLNKKFWLTIIIPVKGRFEFFPHTIYYLKKSIKNVEKNKNIIR